MKNLFKKFNKLSCGKKAQVIIGALLAVALMIAIPTYAWFAGQKKTAEMYKVQYPNSLYINAAHREDQIYFELDSVNVNEFEKDAGGSVIYYTDATYTSQKIINVEGQDIYDTSGVPKVITSQKYAFSVVGTNTDNFKLQLANTNNNQFKYNIYEADEKTKAEFDTLSPIPGNYVVRPANGLGTHTSSSVVFSDDITLNDKGKDFYYVANGAALTGTYLNAKDGSNNLLAKNNDKYYEKNYTDNTQVEEKSVPLYWQSDSISANMDSNKRFCKYFILEVTWDASRTAEKKETDMIAITVKRQ